MPAYETPLCDFGWKAPSFKLKATDGKFYSLDELKGPQGTLVMFICNHCPFVQAIADKIARDTAELAGLGVNSIAIMPNDVEEYPEDSLPEMAKFAARHKFNFPYLIDETQEVAKAYGAICTPDFFGFNARLELQYRGRLDQSKMSPVANAPRDLFIAMRQVAQTGLGPREQTPSIGCSIKWKNPE